MKVLKQTSTELKLSRTSWDVRAMLIIIPLLVPIGSLLMAAMNARNKATTITCQRESGNLVHCQSKLDLMPDLAKYRRSAKNVKSVNYQTNSSGIPGFVNSKLILSDVVGQSTIVYSTLIPAGQDSYVAEMSRQDSPIVFRTLHSHVNQVTMRLDFQLYDESGFWWLAPSHLGGYSLTDFIEKVCNDDIQDLLDRHSLLPITMYGDGGSMRMRFVLGELTQEEQDNWTARTTASLDISTGQLLIGTSSDPDAYHYYDDPEPYSLQEAATGNLPDYGTPGFGYLELPSGLYRADVYCFPPCDMSATWKSIISPGSWAGTHPEAETLAAYFQRTRSTEEMSSWIGYELRLDKVIKDDRFQEPELEKFLEFLIHLTPISEPLPHPALSEGGYTIWETRKPARCPLGVIGDFTIPPRSSQS